MKKITALLLLALASMDAVAQNPVYANFPANHFTRVGRNLQVNTYGIFVKTNDSRSLTLLGLNTFATNYASAFFSSDDAQAGGIRFLDEDVIVYQDLTVLLGRYLGDGSGLTALNATELTSGTVPTARLGSGAASSSTFLRGDQTWSPLESVVDASSFNSQSSISTDETSICDIASLANKITANGVVFVGHVAGTFVNSTSTKRLRLYLNSTLIFDTGAITVTGATSWDLESWFVRDSSTTARCSTKLNLSGASTGAYATQTDVTGINYGATFGLVLTGTSAGAGVANGDITKKISYGELKTP